MAIINGVITTGDDSLHADQADDIIEPLADNNFVGGGGGADLLFGGGELFPDSTAKDDTLYGGNENDTILPKL